MPKMPSMKPVDDRFVGKPGDPGLATTPGNAATAAGLGADALPDADASAPDSVLIGRFQPPDKRHACLLQAALDQPGRVLVVIASAGLARSADNPFTWQERAAMLMAAAGAQGERIRLLAVRDVEDDTAWARALRRGAGCKQGEAPPRLAGFEGDEDFQRRCELLGWDPLPVAPHPGPSEASLRDVLLGGAADQALLTVLRPYLSRPVLEYLRAWLALPYHRELCAEWQALQSIREELANATQPRLQVGVEALVHSEDQVLMLRRGEAPGLGLWALPGALLGHDERLLEASLRALRRQTGIGMLQISLQDALREVRVFDRPHRLPQARLISHVHRFALGDHLPQARGGEGALSVAWLPISALPGMQASIFADHFAILDHFFGLGDPLQVPVDGQG